MPRKKITEESEAGIPVEEVAKEAPKKPVEKRVVEKGSVTPLEKNPLDLGTHAHRS